MPVLRTCGTEAATDPAQAMNWQAVAAITAAVCAVAALASSWATLSLRATVESMRADHAEARARDREELIKWLNGSFMRAPVVEAELRVKEAELMAVVVRVDHLERSLGRPS